MKKIIVVIVCTVSSYYVYGMELVDKEAVQNNVSSVNSKIVIVRDDIYRRTHNADITVVGIIEQLKLRPGQLDHTYCVGDVYDLHDNDVLVMNKVFAKYFSPYYEMNEEVASIIIEDQRFLIKNPFSYIEKKKLESLVIRVVEPELILNSEKYHDAWYYHYSYDCRKKVSGIFGKSKKCKHYQYDEAVRVAQEDLGICYQNVLAEAHKFFTDKHRAKSIAFSQLHAPFDFFDDQAARIAVASVVKFMTESVHKDKYGLIELVVNKEQDYGYYTKYLNSSRDLGGL